MLSFLNVLINPKIAALIASLYIGRPDLADDLIAICNRESRCTEVKTHDGDAYISNPEWFGQTKIGARYLKQGQEGMHLDKRCQKRKAPGGWATHGPWGLNVGSHWNFVPPCHQPSDFDSVVVSALVAVRKYERDCWETDTKHRYGGWCRVPRKVRTNNKKSPRRKQKRKIDRPKSWWGFFTKNP